MNNIFILHFSPIELYPPVQNFIQVLAKQKAKHTFYVLTTKKSIDSLTEFKSPKANIKIIRLGTSGNSIGKFLRLLSYFKFYFGSVFYLLFKWPKKVFYYETLSSFPAYIYKRFFNKNAALFIHYHEYTSPAEYERGMKLTKVFHRQEIYLYPRAQWVSHTNEYRMKLFLKDIAPVAVEHTHIVANYPPLSWHHEPHDKLSDPLKIIYVGSLSINTMYTQSFAEWVQQQKGKVIWDIYSYNITDAAINFFKSLEPGFITLKQGINYNELPNILTKYDVGVILYKGHIPNYIYNAPNKLFEYLACGLDVWYPSVMQGCFRYDTTSTSPKVLRLDFDALSNYALEVLSKKEIQKQPLNFNFEEESSVIIKRLVD